MSDTQDSLSAAADAEHVAMHDKASAILEELYVAKGEPAQLDDAFLKEYFTKATSSLGLDRMELFGPHATAAHLAQSNKGLVDVTIGSKNEKFVAKKVNATQTISGTSQRAGGDRGKGTYVMTEVKGIPNVTIKAGKSVVLFVGLPHQVNNETGKGEWVKI